IAISAGVSISLLVSLTVIPSAASQLLRHQSSPAGGPGRRFVSRMRGLARPLTRLLDGTTEIGNRFVAGVARLTDVLQAGELSRGALAGLGLLFTLGALALVPSTYQPI